MGITLPDTLTMDRRIAERLRSLRVERGWSLDELASRSDVSRATISRLENANVSPTAAVLGRLCAAFELTMSRLMHMVEDEFAPVVRAAEQPVWSDATIGFQRRSVSPPAQRLHGEVLQCELRPGASISYERPPRLGLEHHLYLVEGELEVTLSGETHQLHAGDCLRYQLLGDSKFATPNHCKAKYFLFMV